MEKCERNRRIKQCVSEKLDLRLILDENSFAIINDIAQTTNVSIDYIFLTTIVTLCHWTMGASLKGAQAYNTPLILFGILCGGSGMFIVFQSTCNANLDIIFKKEKFHYSLSNIFDL
ncbi:unnamed protein product [Rotaria magnacalcarata]|uniref:Uncharacterized protein n=1 Tax=Rotaria magnacalcarata TaxID=392030 RepID=A0A8S3DWK9_9BILA|nr:unnamed protein product [Rotaria magnacalcarata]